MSYFFKHIKLNNFKLFNFKLLALIFVLFICSICNIVIFNTKIIAFNIYREDHAYRSCSKCVQYNRYNKYNGYLNDSYLNLKQKVTPNTAVFAFDLHDVLFSKNYKNIIHPAFKALKKGMFWYILNPIFLFKAVSLSMKNKIWEDIYYTLCQDYPEFLNFEEDFFDISNSCCTPICTVIDIVKELKNRGYKLFLLSNIGFNSYENLKKRFMSILSLFDGVYLPNKSNDYHHKPSPEYYTGFIRYLDQAGLRNKQVIFIDDSVKNLQGARNSGISGIHFKNTEQLDYVLKSLSVI